EQEEEEKDDLSLCAGQSAELPDPDPQEEGSQQAPEAASGRDPRRVSDHGHHAAAWNHDHLTSDDDDSSRNDHHPIGYDDHDASADHVSRRAMHPPEFLGGRAPASDAWGRA